MKAVFSSFIDVRYRYFFLFCVTCNRPELCKVYQIHNYTNKIKHNKELEVNCLKSGRKYKTSAH